MKVLYLIAGDLLTKTDSGVYSKILTKARALNELGVETRVVGFTESEEKREDLYTLVPTKGKNIFKTIDLYLKSGGTETARIIFRYPYADPGLLELVKEHPKKIFFEHNTFEVEEALLAQKKHLRSLPFSLRPSYLSYWFRTFIAKKNNEKTFGRKILSHAAGGFCVTHELAAYEAKKSPGYKTFVVSNGANEQVDHLKEAPAFSDTLKAFLLVGDNAPWQGTERIIAGLQAYSDERTGIEVNIIGLAEPPFKIGKLPSNCRLEFTPASKDYYAENKLREYHVTFSTLALYKKGMGEAASLKLRDSMLRGFPAVLAYHDTDVSNNVAFASYTLQIPNDKSPVDFRRVVDFYKKVAQIENYPQKIRALSINTFSYRVKAAQIKAILEHN